ncbi:MAG TPA: hypothetical protein VNO30_27725 [Kofleriaceae bacterium]|nr:hypothetical protein [Kofleriaceae bacterium]
MFRDDPDGQAQAYRTIISPEVRELSGKFDALVPRRPEPPWDKKWAVLEDRKLLLIPSHRESRPIRNTMYPDYRVPTRRWLQSRLETRVGPKTGQEEWRYSEATPVSPSTGEPHWWLLAGPDNEKPTIAHDQPSVGTHWNGTGRFVTQKERGVFMDGLDKGGPALDDNTKLSLVASRRATSRIAVHDVARWQLPGGRKRHVRAQGARRGRRARAGARVDVPALSRVLLRARSRGHGLGCAVALCVEARRRARGASRTIHSAPRGSIGDRRVR